MAVAGIFAGPMFNILMGLGLSLTLVTARQYPEPFEFDAQWDVIVSFSFLVVCLLCNLILVSCNNFHLSRKLGVFLILFYLVFMTLSILLETGVLPDPTFTPWY